HGVSELPVQLPLEHVANDGEVGARKQVAAPFVVEARILVVAVAGVAEQQRIDARALVFPVRQQLEDVDALVFLLVGHAVDVVGTEGAGAKAQAGRYLLAFEHGTQFRAGGPGSACRQHGEPRRLPDDGEALHCACRSRVASALLEDGRGVSMSKSLNTTPTNFSRGKVATASSSSSRLTSP